MPVSGLLSGLVTKYASETAEMRKEQRDREDQDFQHQLQLLEQLRQDPRTTPEMYQRVMADTLKLNKIKASGTRPLQHNLSGIIQGEHQPFAAQVLQDLADGKLPMFQDKEGFDRARQGTHDDLPGGANNPQPAPQQPTGQGHVAGSAPATPPPPTPQPPQSAAPGPQGPPQNLGAARPPDAGAQPAPAGPPPGPGGPPPGPLPTPPGTGQMLDASQGLAAQVAQGGPIVPQPPKPVMAGGAGQPTGFGGGPNAAFGDIPSQGSIFESHRSSPSAFFNPTEMSQIQASSQAAALPVQAKAEYDALVKLGTEPRLALLGVLKKMTGLAGSTTTRAGQLYVDKTSGELVKSLLQSDPYGGFQEIDPRTTQTIGSNMEPFIPGVHKLTTDKDGNVRVVNIASASATGAAGVPGKPGEGGLTGTPGGLSAQPAVGPSLGPIGKPQIPPPVFSGNFTGTGVDGQPIQLGIPRQGGPAVPIPSQAVPGVTVPVPPGGQAEVPTGRPGGKNQPRVAIDKFQAPKPLSAQAEAALTSSTVVKNITGHALDLIDTLIKQGYSAKNAIPQDLYTKIYSLGWANANPVEDQLIQLIGVDQVNGMKTYMGGRPNMKLMDIIKMHLPEPDESLELSRRKLTELQKITDTVEDAIKQAGSTYRQFPWDKNRQAAGAGGAGATPPAPAKTVTKELVQKYATEHKIQYPAALKVFTDKGYQLSNGPAASPAAK